MKERIIYITNFDMVRLEELIASCTLNESSHEKLKIIKLLKARLHRSKVIPWNEIAADIITMNSSVRLRSPDNNKQENYSLVFPEEANLLRNKISVLSELGIFLLGRKLKDVLKLRVYQDVQHFIISEILYQPEANRKRSM